MSAAEVALDQLRQRVLNGDHSVTALHLAEAHAAVELAELRAEADRRKAADPATTDAQRRVEAGERRRRAAKEQQRVAERAGWAAEIDSGRTAQRAADVQGRFSEEFEAFWKERDPEGYRQARGVAA